MSRLYLYGVTRPREVEERLAEQGIFLIAAEDCAAIVSDLDEGPVEATRRNLLAHADVVEQLHVEAVVLPARFGHVLESGEEAFELLALPEIEQLLDGKTIHIFGDILKPGARIEPHEIPPGAFDLAGHQANRQEAEQSASQ